MKILLIEDIQSWKSQTIKKLLQYTVGESRRYDW